MGRRILPASVIVTVLLGHPPQAGAGVPYAGFAKKPTAVREDGAVRITFAVDRQTDVAVYVEDAQGKVVRHLVAGALGGNPPGPLKANSLEQSILWDGTDDDGKAATGGPFRVRVGLRLTAHYGGMAFSEKTGPNHLTGVLGLAAGPDGRVYVMDDRSGWLYWPAKAVHVFRRDGAYERTIKPFPSNLPLERVKAAGAFRNDRGYLNPLIHRTLGMTFYPYEDEAAAQMAVADGRLFLTVVPSQHSGDARTRGVAPHLAAIDLEGGIAYGTYAGPPLGAFGFGQTYLAASPDGRRVYLTGSGRGGAWNQPAQLDPVVYCVRLPERGPAEVFFGDPKQPGNDNAHLANPRAVASDGRGHILVADYGNNRVVVVREADKSMAGSFAFPGPEWVGINPRTGVVYVAGGGGVVRLSNWQDATEQARVQLPARKATDPRARWVCALDSSAEPAVLWAGYNWGGGPPLLRCEDHGDRFSDFTPAGCFESPKHWRPTADPTKRLVACRIGGAFGGVFAVLDEAAGRTRNVNVQPGARTVEGVNQGTNHRLDREGNIYCSAAGGGIWKCGPDGKRIPLPATADDPDLKGHIPAGSTGTTAWERDWYVDRKGDIYAKVRGTAYHGLMHVDVYGPDGRFKRTAIWGVTDGSYGPRVDPQGNLYMMECVKPVGQPFPGEFVPHVTDKMVQRWYDWMYGSIVKFSPAGGNIWLSPKGPNDRPKAEPVALPDSFGKQSIYATFRQGESQMQGASWFVSGAAHCGDMLAFGGGGYSCHCTGCDFDVDEFGRAFAPDNGRQRVTVLDTNGNVILHIGAYGNQDYCGPDSYVLDPVTNRLRPRAPDDPEDLKSPFADPEIAFNWIIGLAVTDRYAYVADCANRRMLRVALGYAAEQTVAAP